MMDMNLALVCVSVELSLVLKILISWTGPISPKTLVLEFYVILGVMRIIRVGHIVGLVV